MVRASALNGVVRDEVSRQIDPTGDHKALILSPNDHHAAIAKSSSRERLMIALRQDGMKDIGHTDRPN